MRDIEQRALEAFRQQFKREPAVLASAPGRVNLIGEHTDYNEGFVLPCAIEQRVAVAAAPGEDILYSVNYDQRALLPAAPTRGWAAYPAGVAWAMREAGYVIPSFDAAIAGNVPLGSGLSSSAAIEAATATALNALADLDLEGKHLALLCQRAENGFVGVNSGIMDQYASLLCQAGSALLIDCRTLEAETVPLDLKAAGLTLLVCDTGTERQLAGTGYNERRAVTERAAAQLGLTSLRDATVDDLTRLQGEELRRARHVVTENLRVLEAVDALRRDDFITFGRLMTESHISLREDYEVSTPALDAVVALSLDNGALGARLTGAGFGGCAIALVPQRAVRDVERAVTHAFAEHAWPQPVFYQVQPSQGATVIPV